mgnify:CR=1 FL=1
MSRKDMPVLGTTYRSIEKSILKTAEKCEHFTMSTKVIKFKTKDKSKVMSKDDAWQHYAAEMTKEIEKLYSTIKTQHTIIASKDKEIETLNESILNTAMYMSEELSKRPKIDNYFEWRDYGIRHFNLYHGHDENDSSDSSSDSEWEDDEDTEAPPPYEQ